MKKIFIFLVLMLMLVGLVAPIGSIAQAENLPAVQAKSAYLMDKRTGQMLYGQRENDHFPIASMVKIMTALLTFEEIEKGSLTFDEKILISDEASGMGGSQMFLESGDEYPVTDLLKGVIVVSANDACVALAERIAGSEAAFVERMNERAKSLGMKNTMFVNATGLPKEGGYSSAHDVALMLSELTNHERYYDYSKIWLEDYTHPDGRITTLTNTNKFVRFYDECDGGKTGYTSEAKFCLSACATRGDTKLISVVIGADDSKTRFAESKRLLLYGFANYKTEILVKKGESAFLCPVTRGKEKEVPAYAEQDISVLYKTGSEQGEYDVQTSYYNVKAPVKKGDKVGEVKLMNNGEEKVVYLIAAKDVYKAGISDIYKRIAEKMA